MNTQEQNYTTDSALGAILEKAHYTDPNWITESEAYYITMNGLGSFWPRYLVNATYVGWCPISIRDYNPFKTLKGAIRFIEKHKERYKAQS